MLSSGLAGWSRTRRARARAGAGARSYGARLVSDPHGVLDLAPGFRYRVLERAGDPMSDGYRVPGRPDAMACFATAGGMLVLMRNHELDRSHERLGAAPGYAAPPEAYDPRAHGGVSRLVLDARGRRLASNLVLTGTCRNCAGGPSPWGFLSCEESVESGHGYVFLTSIQAAGVQPARRIDAYGRFMHEAVAIDPRDHTAYLTEDRGDGCLYRFVPQRREAPFGAGKLQALAVRDAPSFALHDGLTRGATLDVSWVTIQSEAQGARDDLRHQARALGAAVVRRGEGIWLGADGIYFTSTSGGPLRSGQIFKLDPTENGGTLTLVAQAEEGEETFEMPDNLTVMPSGDLLVCEDNRREAFLHVVSRKGDVAPFARNALSRSELAGICFAPDGQRAFVNMQEDGLTLLIEGPFHLLTSSG